MVRRKGGGKRGGVVGREGRGMVRRKGGGKRGGVVGREGRGMVRRKGGGKRAGVVGREGRGMVRRKGGGKRAGVVGREGRQRGCSMLDSPSVCVRHSRVHPERGDHKELPLFRLLAILSIAILEHLG